VKATTIAYCSLLAVFAIQSTTAGGDATPKKLAASSGDTWTGFYHVELHGDILLYWHDYAPYGAEDGADVQRIKPSIQDWRAFREALDAIGIWRWRSGYSTGVTDATDWRVDIQYSDRTIKSGGDSGAFPSKEGIPCPRSDQYRLYVKAMRKLLDRDTFPE
jgi:hypothetical protein